jgi:7-cyano-7-deazaguanine synthase in queuosine biosynthesis
MNILILYSGGLDSLIMKRYAKVNYPEATVTCVWYDIGQEYARKEEAVLPEFVIKHKLDWLNAQDKPDGKDGSLYKDIFIPGRNLVLAVNAACKYLPDEIWMGALLGETHDSATDKNYTFLEHINKTLAYVLSPFHIPVVRFPLADASFNKLTATKWALENEVPVATIMKSSSCLSGEPGNCGKCVVCFRRFCIFKQLGLPEEQYNVHPLEHEPNKEIVREMIQGTYYDVHRKSEILPALPLSYYEKI